MRESRLPAGGENVFQKIRARRAVAEAKGVRLLDLSIGEPKGPALASARRAAAEAVLSEEEAMHAYQYNASPAVPDFARRFVTAHLPGTPGDDVDYLPIPGIKPILGLLPLACGCAADPLEVLTTTRPGYPIPANWCDYHPNAEHAALPLDTVGGFRFAPGDVPATTGLVMMNYPHNPSGQIATVDWLEALCEHCARHDVRLFNDAAYICLAHDEASVALSQIAPNHPDLSWAEAFTAAKLIGNGTGWHVGALAGSADFIADIAEVKGKTDAGLVAPMAAGVIAALEEDQAGIAHFRDLYRQRLAMLSGLLTACGMRLAIEPRAGFYTLWETPSRAFGRRIENAEDFNLAMIASTGVVGVNFADWLRYAVCADVEAMTEDLAEAFRAADVGYD